ncbi:uncharacterized protein LOC144163162 [Haemaphysalis longicornis]
MPRAKREGRRVWMVCPVTGSANKPANRALSPCNTCAHAGNASALYQSSSPGTLGTEAAIGVGVAGGLAVIIMLVFLLVSLKARRRRKEEDEESLHESSEPQGHGPWYRRMYQDFRN